jgi:xanthine dehydrogenase molybdenum-binding subunit
MTENWVAVGKAFPRKDALAKVTGGAQYTADIRLPGMLYAKCLRSPYAHAKILSIDTRRAEALPGIEAVITYKDVDPKIPFKTSKRDTYILEDTVRYVGDEVAAVAAVSEEIAEEALRLIDVEYDVLPAVFDPEEALKPGAPKIHPGGNLATYLRDKPYTFNTEIGEVERGFSESDIVLERTYKTHMQSHVPMEPRASLASWDSTGTLTLWDSNQGPFEIRSELGNVLDLPLSKVRVITPYVGGAFGCKIPMFKAQGIVSLLAKKAGRPVRLEFTREEQAVTGTRRHSWTLKLKVGAKKDGSLMAYHTKSYLDAGPIIFIGIIACLNQANLTPKFSCPNRRYEAYAVYTNSPPASAYRGFGYFEADFAIGMLMDELCEKLGMDPLDFYLKNHIKSEEPHGMSQTRRILAFDEAITRAAEKIGWKEKWHKPGQETLSTGKKHGIGIGISGGNATLGNSGAVVTMNEDGSVKLLTGAPELGQGSLSELSQIITEVLGVKYEDVGVVSADTDVTPYDQSTVASRTTLTQGNAVKAACEDLKQQIFKEGSSTLGVLPEDLRAEGGWIYVSKEPAKRIGMAGVAKEFLLGKPPRSVPKGVLIGRGSYSAPSSPPPATNAVVNMVEVEVDTKSGHIDVTRLVSAVDCGKVINPKGIEAQYESVLSGGLGFALTEELVLSPTIGRVLNPSFLDYKIPTALDYRKMDPVIMVESYERLGPFGAKGVGEAAMAAAAPAVSNAIYNALGIRVELPATPQKVMMTLEEQTLEEQTLEKQEKGADQ